MIASLAEAFPRLPPRFASPWRGLSQPVTLRYENRRYIMIFTDTFRFDPVALKTPVPFQAAPAQPAARLEVAVRSLRSPTAHGRRENQDNYLVVDPQGVGCFLRDEQVTRAQLPDWPAGHWRVAVLDGMGGHSHGREAAQRAAEGLLDLPATSDLDQLSRGLTALHAKLYQEFQNAGLETGCTLIVLEIPAEGPALLFHVGDSRVYAVNREQVQCLTVDHVPATHLALLGLMDNAHWLQQVHIRPNSQISQAFILGSTLGVTDLQADAIGPELFELHDGNLPLFLRGMGDRRLLTLESNWIYLLASDGLWHLLNPQVFIRRWPSLLNRPQHSLEYLVDILLDELADFIRQQRSQPDDNCTVVLLRKSDPAVTPPDRS